MASILVRDLDERVVAGLKQRARSNGRSVQAEVRDILAQAARRSLAETRTVSEQWLLRLSGRRQRTDSARLIRDDRDRR